MSMMRRAKQTALYLCTWVLLAAAKGAINRMPFKRILSMITDSSQATSTEVCIAHQRRALWICQQVDKAAENVFWHSKCYDRALAAALLLRALRIPYTIYFGIRKGEAGAIEAHAWLRCGSLIVTGYDDWEAFTALYQGSYGMRRD